MTLGLIVILDDHGRIPFVLNLNLNFLGFLGSPGFLGFGIGPRRKLRTNRKPRKLKFRCKTSRIPQRTTECDNHTPLSFG